MQLIRGQWLIVEAAQRMDSTKLRVLVVDDRRETLLIIQRLASQFECEIRTCQDSRQAVPMAQAFVPNVIFLDIEMPGMDGFEVAEDLQGLNLPPYTLVAFTTYTDEAHRQECEVAGFDMFLSKPATVADIEHVIKTARSGM